MTKLRERTWSELSRQERVASVLYPQMAEETRRKEMTEISAKNGKKAPYQEPLLSGQQRGAVSPLGGQAGQAR
jgi:hypothetical protein